MRVVNGCVDADKRTTRDLDEPSRDLPRDLPRDLEEDSRELRFVLAPRATPASQLLAAGLPPHLDEAEVSATAQGFMEELAAALTARRGAALLIDYGSDAPPTDSLRGIREHRFVHPLHAPGETDLSADVDFGALRRLLQREGYIEQNGRGASLHCPPLVEQRYFLAAMGIEQRVNKLLARAASDDVRRDIIASVTRLVESPGMGSTFKAFSIAHNSIGQSVPGFNS